MHHRRLRAEDHIGLVRKIARRYARTCRHLTYNDLLSEGAIGLMRAIELFDPSRGFAFSTYATYWIRHGCTRAIANQDRVVRLPCHLLESRRKSGDAVPERTVSLDAPVGDAGDGGKTWHDVYAAPEPDAPEFEPTEVAAVHAAVDELPERAGAVVRGRLQGLTLKQVGTRLGVSRERVRQLEIEALDTLRRRLRGGAPGRAA